MESKVVVRDQNEFLHICGLTGYFTNRVFEFKPEIEFLFDMINVGNQEGKITEPDLTFVNCHFKKGIGLKRIDLNDRPPGWSSNLTFTENCVFDGDVSFQDIVFDGKVRFHSCIFNDKVNFRNTVFKDLADFWKTTFKQNTIFYKTDFYKTVVFSMATFEQNVLFTYSHLAGKSIFAKTEFKQGLDLSQAIVSGDLKLFDLKFTKPNFEATYITDIEKYQETIDSIGLVPLENKVHTYQVLKKAFEDIGNHSDSILMLREEKRALKELIRYKLKDEKPYVNQGDVWILCLNRISNHYRSDFRNGIWFTLSGTIFFGFLTLLFTETFWLHFPSSERTEWDVDAINNGVKFMINFLNPVHKITFIDNLKPFLGIPYIIDFFGRIAVGYGFYQTVQAFRKFK